MKMAILELEYKNIRKITALKLPFTKADGSVISNNFIMMANGTGKTTTMELIKGLFDGTAAGWTASKVRSFAPTLTEADRGEFSITVKFDDRQYKYFLSMNYKDGTVQVETSAPPKGREAGLRLPESIRGIFTPEFVRRFVFDGEQAAKSMDSSSNEADETIRYLYRLDELDEILAANQRILTEIQNAEGKRGTSSSLSNLRTRQSDIDAIRAKLRARCEKLREEIAAFEAEKVEKEKQRQELDKSYEKLNQEKNDILKEQQKNRGEIDVKITSILGIIKSPYLLSESLCARMFELGNSMKKLKLPKTIAKDFFTELASADRCVCDRCIGERERTAILKRADQYLGSDQQSVLNTVKSSLMDSVYDERLKKAFEELEELRAQANRLDTRFKTNEEKLIKAGGEKARELQERIEELIRLISIARDELERIESKDENDASLTEENNLHKADQKFKYYEQEIAKATRTNTPNVEFSFDVAIITKNKNGNYMRLIHNKNVYALGLDQYTWNEVPRSHQVKDKADELKEAGLWQEVRDRYLEKKNMYLSWQDRNHPSFVVYVEAVNEVYNRYFNRGGGYSVQSIF